MSLSCRSMRPTKWKTKSTTNHMHYLVYHTVKHARQHIPWNGVQIQLSPITKLLVYRGTHTAKMAALGWCRRHHPVDSIDTFLGVCTFFGVDKSTYYPYCTYSMPFVFACVLSRV